MDLKFGLTEKDRPGLTLILEKIDLYRDGAKFGYALMPEDKALDQKIMTWAIKELYTSSYRIFLKNLKRDKLINKYLKTKEYITTKGNYKLKDILNYFIVCLQQEFEKQR